MNWIQIGPRIWTRMCKSKIGIAHHRLILYVVEPRPVPTFWLAISLACSMFERYDAKIVDLPGLGIRGPQKTSKQIIWPCRCVWWMGESWQFYAWHRSGSIKNVNLFLSQNGTLLVGKAFPHPVRVFCSQPEGPKCHLMHKSIVDRFSILLKTKVCPGNGQYGFLLDGRLPTHSKG